MKKLGTNGPNVSPIGFGAMALSGVYGAVTDAEGIATVQHALERGINLIDTGDFYGQGHNEMLIGQALRGRRDKALVSVKFGALRGPDGAFLGFDGRPVAVKSACAYSLKRLGVDHIDVYRPGRLDPQVPIEDTVGAIAELIKAGYVRYIGLSELGAETIERAARVHPIADMQIEYSLASRKPEETIFPTLRKLGMSATLYGVMSRGLFSGKKLAANDGRNHFPRFSGEAGATNARAVDKLTAFARDNGRTNGQLALGWVLAKVPNFVPLAGARNREQLDDLLGALDKPLSVSEVTALEGLVPASAFAGERYPAVHMAALDSERA